MSGSWVFNTALPDEQSAGHTEYDPSKSSTFKRLEGESFVITYGDSSNASGIVGTDTVNIGGATVTSQAVELATAVSESFASDVQSDGLVGLGFSRINAVRPTRQKTFFDNISSSLAEPVLTANLRKAAPGAYEFGRIDSTQYTGALEWIPVNAASGFWQFPSNTFSVGDGPVQQNTDGNPAIADTGTSLLLVDQPVVDGYYSEVKGSTISRTAGGVVFPCDAELPDLKIAMGESYMATISGSLLSYAEIGIGTNQDGSRTKCKRPHIYSAPSIRHLLRSYVNVRHILTQRPQTVLGPFSQVQAPACKSSATSCSSRNLSRSTTETTVSELRPTLIRAIRTNDRATSGRKTWIHLPCVLRKGRRNRRRWR